MSGLFSTRAFGAFAIFAAIALAAVAVARRGDGVPVSRVSFAAGGLSWPLNVESGRLGCRGKAVWFKAPDGRSYAVNGMAAGRGYERIDPILAVDEGTLRILEKAGADTSFKPRLDPRDLIAEGLNLC